MSNLFEHGAVWLADQLQAHASVEVIYIRGGEEIPLRATIGRTQFEVDDGSGNLQHAQSRDYLIQAADLVLDGQQTLPIAGDRIREGAFTYEVLAPGNEPPYRYSDPFCQLLRVHTKHVATED